MQHEKEVVRKGGPISGGPKRVLILGASTGYGLSSRITAAFGCGAATVGVFFERPSTNGRPASAGWYNSVAFEKAAASEGLYAKSINGDAFSTEIKEQTLALLKDEVGPVDLVIYSLASPRRTDPATGETYKSVLKPVGSSFTAKSVDTDKELVTEVTLEPATDEDIAATQKVMGGEDWFLWMDVLAEAGLLAPGAKTVAYSYIGPELTYPIYRNGTIGKAKEHLEGTAAKIAEKHQLEAYVSVNKAVVTQASSAIPVVPLYLSILIKKMEEQGIDEDCIEQIDRLFRERLYTADGKVPVDNLGRIRVDDWEMRGEIQQAVESIWPLIDSGNLRELSDFARYQQKFIQLFGFGVDGVDYDADVEIELDLA